MSDPQPPSTTTASTAGPAFQRRDAIKSSVPATLIGAGAGAFISGIQNALTKQNVGALGVLTRTGSVIGMGAAVGGGYMFVRVAAANLRSVEDAWNPALGGLVAGAIMGTRFRTLPAVVGYGAALSATLAVFDITGGSLLGTHRHQFQHDEFGRKQALRANRRRPIDETIAHIGEGRGIYPAGYDSRRRERVAQRYGVEFEDGK